MTEGFRSRDEQAVLEAESQLVPLINGTKNLATLQQTLYAWSINEAEGGLRTLETTTHIFSKQADALEQLITIAKTEGAEAAIAQMSDLGVTEKYGIALKARDFLEKRAVSEKQGEVDFDPTKTEDDLDLVLN